MYFKKLGFILLTILSYTCLLILYEAVHQFIADRAFFSEYKIFKKSYSKERKQERLRMEEYSEDFPRCSKCNSQNYFTEISPECSVHGKTTNDTIDILILVICDVKNFKARQVIRSTWGNTDEQSKVNAKVIFVLGNDHAFLSQIQKEQEMYQDLLLFNFSDGYRILSKKMVHVFRWISENCSNVKYILKTDTDTFVNVAFLHKLVSQNTLTNILGGSCEMRPTSPSRDRRNPHFVTRSEYSGIFYPPYCYGCGYLLNKKSLEKITKTLENMPLFPNEDVWLGIAAQKSGISIQNLPGFYRLKIEYSYFKFCYCVALVHKLKLHEIQKIWLDHKHCHRRWFRDYASSICLQSNIQRNVFFVCGILIFVSSIVVWFRLKTVREKRRNF